ncbi:hypothetical protein GCM10008955_25690 [Deinococcus malanensis]|uniref:Uncharacterized protein n=1 Tax=Deinococcus malanensis TaxID=1706855 RepID=A0ABQ2EX60_9DEIO|nr:hypothetical protein GCM10008955_25690 [Deinococcus malanensis]
MLQDRTFSLKLTRAEQRQHPFIRRQTQRGVPRLQLTGQGGLPRSRQTHEQLQGCRHVLRIRQPDSSFDLLQAA